MATVFFVWQLGGGFGHLIQNLPLAEGLAKRGHHVFFAFRHLPDAGLLYAQSGVRFLQAPAKSGGIRYCADGIGFAQLLANTGFGSDPAIFALASAWRNLFKLTNPDLIVFDHSPAALLAARCFPSRRVLIGSGFCCPPDTHPLPILRPRAATPEAVSALMVDETKVLMRINWMLKQWRQPPLQRVGQLYSDVDDTFLVTFPELDHFGPRPGVRYRGPVNGAGGAAPAWPQGPGKRVAAYLKPSSALGPLLEALAQRGDSTLVFSTGIDRRTRDRFASPNISFVSERLDPSHVARECDLAILNATHGSSCDMLLAGKPILQLPIYAEQELLAAATTRLGAAEAVSAKKKHPAELSELLDRLLTDDRYAQAARRFAERHCGFDPVAQRAEMLDRLSELLEGTPARAAAVPRSLVPNA